MSVSAAGKYDVYLDWAVHASTADNPYRLQIGDATINGRVASTGTWDDYRQAKIGTVQLKQGQQRVALQGVGKPSNCLIDLREICLVPVGQPAPAPFDTDDATPKR